MSPAPVAQEKPVIIEMSGVSLGALQDPESMVLEDVNWTVEAGDYWVIAGMHGSGKSDLLALAAGLMAPQTGRYLFFGHEMPIFGDELLQERLRVGLVFAGGQLFHHLTVAENIALPILYHRKESRATAAQRVEAVLELTGLSHLAAAMPGALGRNWQKRVGLARTLSLQPEVLLLDTPLSGMDMRHMNWWLEFLGQLSHGHSFMEGRPVTIIAAAEDLRPWRDRADHIAILQKKKLIVLGHCPQLANHPEPLVKELLAEIVPGQD